MIHVGRYLDPELVERLQQLQLSARRVVEGSTTGSHRSPVKGASVDFREHRFYSPGDEPRRLDWRLLARTDRPYVKEYDEETNLRGVLLLDASASMGYGEGRQKKIDYAQRLVAALAYLMLGQTESVGLGLASDKLHAWIGPRGGTPQLASIIDALDRMSPGGQLALPAIANAVASRLERRSLVVLVSDLLVPVADLRTALARLAHERHETIVIRVLHEHERTFPFERWTQFDGLEGERPRSVEPGVARRQYLERFTAHERAMVHACRSAGAEHSAMDTHHPLADAVTAFLHRRTLG